MSDLEQRIKKAAETDITDLFRADDIKALLAEKDAALESLKAEIERLNGYMERVAGIEEKSHLQTIDERDAAEEALSQAYYLIKGESPHWSNLFGHTEALEDIDDAQKCLRSEINSQKDTINDYASQVESLKARAEQWEKVAADYRNYHKDTPRSCSIFNSGDRRCSICKAYDALSEPREGEQG